MNKKTPLKMAAALLLFGNAAFALDYTWNGSGNWNTTANWLSTSGTFPGSTNDNAFVGGGTGNLTINGGYSINNLTFTAGGRNITTTTTGSYNFVISGTLIKSSTLGNYIRDQNTAQLSLSVGQISQSNGILYLGDLNSLYALSVTNGVTLSAGSMLFNVDTDYSLGLVSTSGASAKVMSLINSTGAAYSRNVTVTGLDGTGTAVTINASGTAPSSGIHSVSLLVDTAGTHSTNAILADGSSGVLSLEKAGVGTQTLAGAGTYSGGTLVSAGTLVVAATGVLGSGDVTVSDNAVLTLQTALGLGDTADLILNSLSIVNLDFVGSDTIGMLSFDGGATFASIGTWGSLTSSAMWKSELFTGDGLINVTAVPEPGAIGLLALGLGFVLLKLRRPSLRKPSALS